VAEDLKSQPNYCCAAYEAMARAWAIMRDTCAGTLHLRDQGSRYLPIEPAEDTRDFEIRRSRANFFNAVGRTLHRLVGLVFRKEPTLGDDAPEAIRGREATDTASALEGHRRSISNRLIRAGPVQLNHVQVYDPPGLRIHLRRNAVGFSPRDVPFQFQVRHAAVERVHVPFGD
jgi:hypothetical protein